MAGTSIDISRVRAELGNGIAQLLEPSARNGRIEASVAAARLSGVDATNFERWVKNSGDASSAVGVAYHGDSAPRTPTPSPISDDRIATLIKDARRDSTASTMDAVLTRFFRENIDALTPAQAAKIAKAGYYGVTTNSLVVAYANHHAETLRGNTQALKALRGADRWFGRVFTQATADTLAGLA